MKGILMFHYSWGTKSLQCPPATTFLKRKESRSPSAYQPNALPPDQTGSPDVSWFRCVYITLCAHDGPRATFPSARLPPASGGCDLLVPFAHRDNYELGSVGVWCRRVGRIMHLPVGRSAQLFVSLSPTTWYTVAKSFCNRIKKESVFMTVSLLSRYFAVWNVVLRALTCLTWFLQSRTITSRCLLPCFCTQKKLCNTLDNWSKHEVPMW